MLDDELHSGESVKRYMLFAGDQYYPNGGMRDYQGSYDTVDEARLEVDKRRDEGGQRFYWFHVYDIFEGHTVVDVYGRD